MEKRNTNVQFKRIVKQALINLNRNRLMIFASLLVTLVAMLVLGACYMAVANVNHMISSYVEQEYTLSVFLWDSVSDEEATKFGALLDKDERIASYTYVSKAEAYADYKANFPEEQFDVLFADKGTDFLPVSFNIVLKDASLTDAVLQEYEKITFADLEITPGEEQEAETNVIYEASSTEDLMVAIGKMRTYLFVGGIITTVLMIFFAMIIISNTVMLTVFSRKKEIEIMSYVGATEAYIKGPFVFEGGIIGFAGGVCSFFLLWGVYSLLYSWVSGNHTTTEIFELQLMRFGQLAPLLLVILLVAGSAVGALGALISAGKHIKK